MEPPSHLGRFLLVGGIMLRAVTNYAFFGRKAQFVTVGIIERNFRAGYYLYSKEGDNFAGFPSIYHLERQEHGEGEKGFSALSVISGVRFVAILALRIAFCGYCALFRRQAFPVDFSDNISNSAAHSHPVRAAGQ